MCRPARAKDPLPVLRKSCRESDPRRIHVEFWEEIDQDRHSCRALAGATVAAVGLSAGSASASPSCTGSNIIGEGSSLQKNAQQVSLDYRLSTADISNNEDGTDHHLQRRRQRWRGWSSGTSMVSPDDQHRAPVRRHRRCADRNADQRPPVHHRRAPRKGAKVLTIPVTQTSIAVVGQSACRLHGGGDHQRRPGERVRRDPAQWSQLSDRHRRRLPATPRSRGSPRLDSSGTTFEFKNYLMKINSKALACTTGLTKAKPPGKN